MLCRKRGATITPMSFEDPNVDPSTSREPASQMDIELMESLALDLISRIPADVTKDFICGTESGAYFNLGTLYQGEVPTPQPRLILTLGHVQNDNISLMMGFNFQNELVECRTKDEQLNEAIAIAQDLLDDKDFSEEMHKVIRFAQNVLLHVTLGVDSAKAALYAGAESPDDMPVAQLGRELVDACVGSLALSEQELGIPVGDDGFVEITTQKVLHDSDQAEDADIEFGTTYSELRIKISQNDGAYQRVYNRLADGTQVLEVSADTAEPSRDTIPFKTDVSQITTALVEASIVDADTTWLQG